MGDVCLFFKGFSHFAVGVTYLPRDDYGFNASVGIGHRISEAHWVWVDKFFFQHACSPD